MSDRTREPDPISEATVSRRRFLAAGAVPLVPLVLPHEAAAGAPPPTVYDVTTYGAQGDGTSDDRGPIQAAIDAASARGGGTVVFPAGTFRIGGALTIRSQIVLRGAGVRTTVIRKSGGGNYPLLQSPGFPQRRSHPQLLPTEPVPGREPGCGRPGPRHPGHRLRVFALQRHDLRLRGPGNLERVLRAASGGRPLDGGDARQRDRPPLHTGRDLLERAALSRWTNIVVALCGPAGIEHGSTTKAVEVGNFGPGLRAANCHVWGLNQAYGWWLEGEAPGLVNCTAEGAEIAQVVVIGNDTQIVGGKYFGARAGSRLPPSRSESSGFRRRPERSSTRRS